MEDYSPLILAEDPRVPRDQMIFLEDRGVVCAHPVTYLQIVYPMSPVWSERTLGHRELERDRRNHAPQGNNHV